MRLLFITSEGGKYLKTPLSIDETSQIKMEAQLRELFIARNEAASVKG